MDKLGYDAGFYEIQKNMNISSAEQIVPLVLKLIRNEDSSFSVIDLGCGSGNWLSVFKKHGCRVLGVDGGDIPAEHLMISCDEFISHDFRNPFKSDQKFDLAVSLECAEHIPEDCSDEFLDSLTALSDIILFSAAIPHQRGNGHVNEQYQQYWVDKFNQRGYEYYDAIRKDVWNDGNVRAFYAQNIFLYVNRDSSFYKENKQKIEETNDPRTINMVNPRMWEDLNNYRILKIMDKMHENRFFSWVYYKFVKKHIKFN